MKSHFNKEFDMTKAAEMFDDWSPTQLATALGFRINLVGEVGHSTAYLCGKPKPYSHATLFASLSRLAKLKGVNPKAPPLKTPRALRNGLAT